MNDFEPEIRTPEVVDLERLSIDELRERIVSLQTEIEACEKELEKKTSQMSAANSLFGEDD